VTRHEIDAYLASLDEPKRSTLEAVRRSVLDVVPDAEDGLAYGAPAFRLQGRTVAGFAAYTNHLSYLPHSGSVLAGLGDAVAGYRCSKGALRFAVDTPLPPDLVATLVNARLDELGLARG
jgi:uncharacterized protein YdhG (YjbR/CyaY superfamily)